MAFLIRTIQRKANGDDIVRDKEVANDSLTIGRSSESDLHLPDLAVEQNHAAIEPVAGTQLKITSASTLGFTLNGKNTQEAVVDPRQGAELGFGTYRLTLSQDGDSPVMITMSQTEAVAGASDALAGFALSSALPSKRSMAWIGLGAILLAFLAIPIFTHVTRDKVVDPNVKDEGQVLMDASWSTGSLSLAHHGLEDNCEACHVDAFVSVRDETCLTCHEEIGDHAPIPRQVKGRGPMSWGDDFQWAVANMFGKEGPGNCSTCHTEHEGAGEMEPTSQIFCAECHDALDSRLTDTVLGNAADFGTAHPEFQAVLWTGPAEDSLTRISLAEDPKEYTGIKFPHDLHMETGGGVARMAGNIGAKNGYGEALVCKDCHTSTADKAMFLPVNMEEDCESCHSLVYDRVGSTYRTLRHGDVDELRADLAAMDRAPRRPITRGRTRPGEFARGGLYYQNFGAPVSNYVGINRAMSRDGVCGECHTPTTVNGKLDVMPVREQERYFLNGYFDHEDHLQEDCVSCHTADTSSDSADLMMPDLNSCRDCHMGEDVSSAEVPSSCAMCHSYHPGEDGTSGNPGMPNDGNHDRDPDRVARLGRETG